MPPHSQKPTPAVEKFTGASDDKRTPETMAKKVSPIRRAGNRQDMAIPTNRTVGALHPEVQDLAELLATLAYQQLQSGTRR